MWTLFLWLNGCSTKTSCDTVMNDFCTLEVACGRSPSQAACQTDFANTWTCNDSDPLAAQRAACARRLEDYATVIPTVCYDRFPVECSDVICDQVRGCDFSTTYETGQETLLHSATSPTSGSGQGTGTHTGGEN